MFCPQCGADLGDQPVCSHCGFSVSAPPDHNVPDNVQGSVIPDDARSGAAFNDTHDSETSDVLNSAAPEDFGVSDLPEAAPAPKKSHTGLIIGMIAAAVVVIGVGVAAVLTNLFGLLNGPLTDLLAAAKNNQNINSAHTDMEFSVSKAGQTVAMSGSFDIAYDEADCATMLGTLSVDDVLGSSLSIDMGLMGDQMVMSLFDSSISYNLPDPLKRRPISSDSDLPLGNIENFKTLYPEAYAEIDAKLDIDQVNSCIPNLLVTLNNTQWLEQNAEYTKTESSNGTVYHFKPDLETWLRTVLEALHPAFRNESDYQDAIDSLNSPRDDLDLLSQINSMTIDITVKDNYFVSADFKVDSASGESIKLSVGVSQINSATVDTATIQDMLDTATNYGDFDSSIIGGDF